MKGLKDFNLFILHFTYYALLSFRFVPVDVAITSELPLGSGLGSSAAFCVAISAALLALSGSVNVDQEHCGWMVCKEDELVLLNKWAFEGEKIIHGKPSGIDNTVSTYGMQNPFSSYRNPLSLRSHVGCRGKRSIPCKRVEISL